MPPATAKRQRHITSPRTGHKGGGQPSISAFFVSPSKQPQRSSPIAVADSDEDDIVAVSPTGRRRSGASPSKDIPARASKRARTRHDGSAAAADAIKESDEAMAQRLAVEWEVMDTAKMEPQTDAPKSKPETVNDSKTTAVHPLFAKARPSAQRQKTPPTSSRHSVVYASPTKITSVKAEPVEPIDFDTDPFLFRPADVDVSRWPRGRLPYSILVGVYVQVSSTRSRLLIVRVLTNFLHLVMHASPPDLAPSLYLLSNHLLPSYIPSELGIGSQILNKTIKEVSGARPGHLRALWQKYGDPGDVAFEAKNNLHMLVTPAPLLVHDVYARLLGLIKIRGSRSGAVKGDVVRKLVVQARGEEVRFLVRTLVGNLRTLLTSLARAAALFNAPPDARAAIAPIPDGKKKPPPDPAREALEARLDDANKLVRKVYVRHPNYADLVIALSNGGLDNLEERVPVSVGIPLSPMLGSITRSLDEVFTRLGSLPFTAEAKLDGQRVQMHVRLDGPQGEDDGGRWVENDEIRVWVRLFSRHLEDMTAKYPDICALALALVSRQMPTPAPFPAIASAPSQSALDLLHAGRITSFIIDAEVVAIDKDTGARRTFQELTNRAKKDVRPEDIKVVVEVCAFDLMVLNDAPLLGMPFSHRRHLLRTLLPPFGATPDPLVARFDHVESIDSTACADPAADIQAFFEKVVEAKCEGLMVKLLESGEGIVIDGDEDEESAERGDKPATIVNDKGGKGKQRKKPLPATYEPDQRSMGWLKVKKDYLEGLGDSLDLVPIGAWWGQGRKAGWWSPILLAAHNPETGALEAVCKCISGFSDAFYKDLIVRYPPTGMPEKCSSQTELGYYETNGLRPDVWFAPSEVWEIRGADITLSPVYPAAASYLGSERGLSMRFPRFMKIRDDKSVEEATTSEQFADMYRRQIAVGTNADRPAKGKSPESEGKEAAEDHEAHEDDEEVDDDGSQAGGDGDV